MNNFCTECSSEVEAITCRDTVIAPLMDAFGLRLLPSTIPIDDEICSYNVGLLSCLLISDAMDDMTKHGNGLIVQLFKHLIPIFR